MSAIPATPAFEDETRAASPAAGLHPALTKNHAPRDDVPEKTATRNFSSDEEPVGSTTPSNAEAPAPKPKRRKPRWPKHVRDAIKAGAAAASRVRSPYSPDPEARSRQDEAGKMTAQLAPSLGLPKLTRLETRRESSSRKVATTGTSVTANALIRVSRRLL